ncbi:MAG: extracellular solute-binding protein [Armatimonadetes bacterium]|nr:extracellular solute-binding protein [Armatimonadota bacterium]
MKLLLGLAALTAMGSCLVGCGDKGSQSNGESGGSEKPLTGDAKELKGNVEVAAFKGGYGIDFYEAAAKEFQTKHPGVTMNVWGNPRIWEQLRPRFVKGDVPDLAFPGWLMDHWALAEEGQLMTLDSALDSMAEDGKTRWRDTFDPRILKLGQLNGKQYVLPYYVMAYGWWYDPGVFAKNGWLPPKSYTELLDLCAKISSKGIAPITFQGQYPYYMVNGMLLPWCYSAGGAQAVKDAQNMEVGAWKSPGMLKAASMIAELNDKGFFQKGAVAMNHTDSQQEFLQGRAAMIPCGTWLYSEMLNVMPKGAKMEFFLPPVVADGAGDPTAMMIGIEPWMVPTDAKNPDAGIAFFKFMTSVENAKKFVEQKGTLMSIKDSEPANLPEVLKKPAEAYKASADLYSNEFRAWYPDFEKELESALTALLNKQLSAQQFCDRVELAAEEKVRKNDSVKKHKVS